MVVFVTNAAVVFKVKAEVNVLILRVTMCGNIVICVCIEGKGPEVNVGWRGRKKGIKRMEGFQQRRIVAITMSWTKP